MNSKMDGLRDPELKPMRDNFGNFTYKGFELLSCGIKECHERYIVVRKDMIISEYYRKNNVMWRENDRIKFLKEAVEKYLDMQ